jgi:hypothetical protein
VNSAAFTPSDANSWLRSHDWERLNPAAKLGALWRRGEVEVLVPLQTDAVDFSRRWNELLLSLSTVHNISPSALADDFLHQGSDVSEWSAAHPNLIDNTIPVSALHTLTGTVQSSYIAAANSTLSPRGYFGHSIPHQARRAADMARAGQTREGSYVIPVISRLPLTKPDREGTLQLDVALQPYKRQVMGTLASALTIVHELAVQSARKPSRSAINDSVREGVSHELCSALADSLETPSIGQISVSFKWARALPWDRPEAQVSFPAEARALVRGMADDLKGSPVVGEQRLVGFVSHFGRGEEDELGRVTLRAMLGGSERSIRLFLSDEQYHTAGEANLNRRTVYVRGNMERTSGRMWEFKDVQDFGIVAGLPIE